MQLDLDNNLSLQLYFVTCGCDFEPKKISIIRQRKHTEKENMILVFLSCIYEIENNSVFYGHHVIWDSLLKSCCSIRQRQVIQGDRLLNISFGAPRRKVWQGKMWFCYWPSKA
ncbi:uncharacterized protein LOC133798514 [Humulus lupulus]|uniref:uncharacterized protein LOC133798514 n=1 Tax=Humulus lupulus TaxID=3486 RepID=UPI002B40CBA3|nr:uncharacterized protein LOC133798514 [Humulus lupulus]